MNLLETFLKELANQDIPKLDVRLLDVKENLRQQIGHMTISEYSKKHSINSGTLSHMLKGKRAVPLSLLDFKDLNRDMKLALKDCNIPIKIHHKLTEKLAYLVGMLRDGTVTEEAKGEFCVAFYSIHRDFLEKIKEILFDVFGIQSPVRKFGENFGIRIRSKTLYLFFKLVFETDNDQSNWNTPKIIRNAPNEIKRAYISGFWDAEGGVPHLEKYNKVSRKNLYVKFVQKNKEPLEFIKNVLDSNKIETGNVYWEQSKHVLKIRVKSIKSFSSFIDSLHPAKAKRLVMLTKLLQ